MRCWSLLLVAPLVLASEASIPLPEGKDASGRGVYDPLRGLDPDGRIPKVPLPADLAHPERWRYIPEGRIHPGNVFERFLVTSFVSPILYFEEDIGFGGGIALTDIDFRHQRRREFLGVFAAASTEGQETYAMVWRRSLNHRDLPQPGGGVIVEERSWLRASVGYDVIRTRRFYGLGADTQEDDETSFTEATGFLRGLGQWSLPNPGSDWIASAGVRYEHHDLADGLVSDAGQTTGEYPGLIAEGDDHDAVWFTAGLRYDTRDSLHHAYRGFHLGVDLDAAPVQSRSMSGTIVSASGGYVLAVPSFFHDGGDADEENPPTDTVVIGAFVKDCIGDIPFWALPSLGGSDTLRGYIGNRFTGRAAWHAAIEWRTWPVPRGVRFTDAIRIERLGLALFAEMGSVADDARDLDEATVHSSVGIGARLAIERTAVFRIDTGFSDEGPAVSATFGMSL